MPSLADVWVIFITPTIPHQIECGTDYPSFSLALPIRFDDLSTLDFFLCTITDSSSSCSAIGVAEVEVEAGSFSGALLHPILL